jgi:TolB-like protein/Tfp pilus assembly protein PilF
VAADVGRLLGRAAPAPAPAAASAKPAPKPAPQRRRGGVPSLAVLPFTNRSGLAEDDVFAFGMVEDIIDAMSQGVDLRVLSSSAVARFRPGGVPDLDGLARQLGVRYVLEGNVRRVGADLRVTTQLVEAAGGGILWTQKFDRPLAQLAQLQQELVLEVAAKLRTQSHRLEIERALRKPDDLTAWEAVMRSIAAYRRMTGPALMLALQEARKAVEIAPDYGVAVALAAQAQSVIYNQLLPDDPQEAARIRAQVEQAIGLDPDNPIVLSTAASALANLGFAREALASAERAIALNPNNEFGHAAYATAATLLDRCDEAIAHFDREHELAPDHPVIWVSWLWRACAEIRAGRWTKALEAYDHSLQLTPDNAAPNLGKAICCRELGRADEARTFVARGRQCEPETPLTVWELRFGRAWGGSESGAAFLDHLRALWPQGEPSAAAAQALGAPAA